MEEGMKAEQDQGCGCTVSQVMTHCPIFAESSDTVGDVARLLWSGDIRHVPVVDEGLVIGMISDRDLRSYIGVLPPSLVEDPKLTDRLQTPIAELIQSDLISVSPEDDIMAVVEIMLDQKVGAVPVLEDREGRLVGIVSYIDILRLFQNQNQPRTRA